MLNLCKGENRLEILRKTVQGEPITNKIVKKFNPAIEFTEADMISMLYYLGYLTISWRKIRIARANNTKQSNERNICRIFYANNE